MIPVTTGIIHFKDLCSKISRVFFMYLIISLIIEIIATVLAIQNLNNHLFYNLANLITGLFIAYLVYDFTNSQLAKFSSILILGFLIANFCIQPFGSVKLFCIVSNTFQFITSILILYHSNEAFEEPFHLYFEFWFYSGLLIYRSTTITLYLLFDYILDGKSSSMLTFYYLYQFITNLIVNLLYTKAFLCLKKA